jgi:hypothetical protein
MGESLKATQEQAGTSEQDEREGYLRAQERRAKPLLGPTTGDAASRQPEPAGRGSQLRNGSRQRERHSGNDGEGDDEDENGRIDREISVRLHDGRER